LKIGITILTENKMEQKRKTGVNENWVEADSALVRKSDARNKLEQAKLHEIGKKYIRIPHPTIKNTFILKEKK
jgi:hypothetical protein